MSGEIHNNFGMMEGRHVSQEEEQGMQENDCYQKFGLFDLEGDGDGRGRD